MRGLLLIGIIIGAVVFLVLRKEDVERFDLDDAENKVEQVEQEVNKAVEDAQKKLNEALREN